MEHAVHELLELIPAWEAQSATVSPLSGGLTNRNYRVDTPEGSFVLRLSGENSDLLGIDREHEHACSVAAAELGIGPDVIAYMPEHKALVTRFIPDRLLSPEEIRRPDVLARVAASLRRFHDGPARVGSFSPFHTVRRYVAHAQRFQVRLPEMISRAIALMDVIEAELATSQEDCPCHNDLLAANLFDDGWTVRIIDWEYGGVGDRFFDLGNLAVNNEFEEPEELALLQSYFGDVRPEHLRRLRLMRLASDLRESMWGFLQAGISSLGIDYPAYAHKHLDRFIAASERLHLALKS